MKSILQFSLLLCFLSTCFIPLQANDAEGIQFFKGSWEEALAEAKKQDKVIFVDAYTTWCGPCKMMTQRIFPQAAVGKFYNANFINVKLDMEKGDGLAFRKKYGVRAFPTLLYINSDGEVVHKSMGFKQPEAFIALGKQALKKKKTGISQPVESKSTVKTKKLKKSKDAKVASEGIQFFKGTWKEALTEAKKQDKVIFVDAYTTWCGPCKMMAKKVFTQEAVGDFYNENFLNVKLDMEKGEGKAFRKKYRVTAFPTLLYLNGDGNLVHRAMGAKQPAAFIALGKQALTKRKAVNRKSTLEVKAKYDKGDRSPEVLREYALGLKDSDDGHLKVANEYLATQNDFSSKENIEFLSEMISESDSKLFEALVSNKKAAIKQLGQDKYDMIVNTACLNTIKKAVEFEIPELKDDAVAQMTAHGPKKRAEVFPYEADMMYAAGTENTTDFTKAASKFLKKGDKKDAAKYKNVSMLAFKVFNDDQTVLKQAAKWAEKGADLDPSAEQYLNYATLLKASEQDDKALKALKKARELAIEEKKPTRNIDAWIRKLESK